MPNFRNSRSAHRDCLNHQTPETPCPTPELPGAPNPETPLSAQFQRLLECPAQRLPGVPNPNASKKTKKAYLNRSLFEHLICALSFLRRSKEGMFEVKELKAVFGLFWGRDYPASICILPWQVMAGHPDYQNLKALRVSARLSHQAVSSSARSQQPAKLLSFRAWKAFCRPLSIILHDTRGCGAGKCGAGRGTALR